MKYAQWSNFGVEIFETKDILSFAEKNRIGNSYCGYGPTCRQSFDDWMEENYLAAIGPNDSFYFDNDVYEYAFVRAECLHPQPDKPIVLVRLKISHVT